MIFITSKAKFFGFVFLSKRLENLLRAMFLSEFAHRRMYLLSLMNKMRNFKFILLNLTCMKKIGITIGVVLFVNSHLYD